MEVGLNILHTEKFGPEGAQLVGQLIQDDHCQCDPRDQDNIGTMVCFHRNYQLGDAGGTRRKMRAGLPIFPNADSFRDFMEETKPIVLPLYLYDHSGITMSTRPFGCRWDSGQIGWIYCSIEKAKQEFPAHPSLNDVVEKALHAEVEIYDQHLRGNCYGYQLQDDQGTLLDSCWGFHGYQCVDWDYALSQLRDCAASTLASQALCSNI